MNEEVTLKDVVQRLDQLIALWKLTNRDLIRKIKNEIMKDEISRKILELADGSREYTLLAEEVAKLTGKTSRTVKSRIAELSEMGIIRGTRKKGKVYYETTGVLD